MDERRDGPTGDGEAALRGPEGRISLRRLDALMLGTLPAAEADALRLALERDPAAKAYVERLSAMRPRRGYADLEARLRDRAPASLPARLRAALATLRPRGGTRPGNARSAPRLPIFGGAAAAFAALLLGASLWIGRWEPAGPAEGGFRAKGGARPEIALRHRGTEFVPGALVPARSGDTLAFAYRSADSLHIQIWYQEDGGGPAPMTGPGGFTLPPATAWTEASQRIRLEGSWKRQQLWILLSRRSLDRERAADAVRRGRGDGAVELATYRLAAPEE